jgi:hypothetical protein
LLTAAFRICDRVEFARISISRDNAWAGALQKPATSQLDATAEETMSPIARRPMPSSLLAAA